MFRKKLPAIVSGFHKIVNDLSEFQKQQEDDRAYHRDVIDFSQGEIQKSNDAIEASLAETERAQKIHGNICAILGN